MTAERRRLPRAILRDRCCWLPPLLRAARKKERWSGDARLHYPESARAHARALSWGGAAVTEFPSRAMTGPTKR